jgi:DNA invertase Pin-like site-specific DNA recombinase
MKIIGYLRVSTEYQDVENQKLGIYELANRNNLQPVEFIEETISGKISYRVRKLGSVITTLQKGDVLIVSELSRLGRSMLEILEILNEMKTRDVRVLTVKENHEINGREITSKVMTMVFGMLAELERDLISKRTKEALASRKSQGIRLGRPPGAGKSKLDIHHDEIKKLFDKGVGITSLSKIFDCTAPTMSNYVRKKIKPAASNN